MVNDLLLVAGDDDQLCVTSDSICQLKVTEDAIHLQIGHEKARSRARIEIPHPLSEPQNRSIGRIEMAGGEQAISAFVGRELQPGEPGFIERKGILLSGKDGSPVPAKTENRLTLQIQIDRPCIHLAGTGEKVREEPLHPGIDFIWAHRSINAAGIQLLDRLIPRQQPHLTGSVLEECDQLPSYLLCARLAARCSTTDSTERTEL